MINDVINIKSAVRQSRSETIDAGNIFSDIARMVETVPKICCRHDVALRISFEDLSTASQKENLNVKNLNV